ncbi:MAG: DUF6677 family protein, partial [Planctomycetota bacterium]
MSKNHTTVSAKETVAMFELNLKNRALAALLAWLVPGLGHLYQGRTAKGLLFMICLVSTFAFGCYIGEGRVVYAATDPLAVPGESLGGRVNRVLGSHWKFMFQAGIGSVAIPAVVERQRMIAGKEPLLAAVRPPYPSGVGPKQAHKDDNDEIVTHPDELARWQYEGGFYFELGAIYTVIAGLLNILVVYDAYSGPLIILKGDEASGDSGA